MKFFCRYRCYHILLSIAALLNNAIIGLWFIQIWPLLRSAVPLQYNLRFPLWYTNFKDLIFAAAWKTPQIRLSNKIILFPPDHDIAQSAECDQLEMDRRILNHFIPSPVTQNLFRIEEASSITLGDNMSVWSVDCGHIFKNIFKKVLLISTI